MERSLAPFQAKAGEAFNCSKVVITSERLILQPLSERYAAEIFSSFTADVTRYMNPRPPRNIDETLEFIRSSRAGMQQGNNLQFVILHRESQEFLGCCGLHGQENPHTPELGIWLKIPAHGHGYGREAITAVKEWADQHLLFDYLIYPVDRANIPSRKIPEALGGEVFEEMHSPTEHDKILDLLVYRLYPAG